MRTRNLAASVLLLIAPGVMRAQDAPAPLVTDRPDQTESSLTVPKTTVQIETGWTITGFGGVQSQALLSTLVRYGAGPSAELRVGFGGLNRTPAGTWQAGDFMVGFKQRVYAGEGKVPSIAVLVHAVIPTGGGRFLPNGRVSLSHELSEKVGLGYNLGVSAFDGGTQTDLELIYTATAGISVAEQVGFFAEVFGNTPFNDPASNGTSVDGGFTFLLSPRVQLDVSGGVGVTATAPDWFFGAGFSIRVPS